MKRILLTYLLLLILPAISIASDLTDFTGVGGDFSDGGDTAGADRTLGQNDNYSLGIKTNGIVRHHITADGKHGFGTTSPSSPNTVNKFIQIGSTSDSATGLHLAGTIASWEIFNNGGNLRFFHDTSEMVRIRSTGDFGINETNPDAKLEVNGTIHATGKITGDGGVDPAYVLYDRQTRQSTIDRIKKEVPKSKLGGATMFFNSTTNMMEIFIATTGKFFDLAGNELASGTPITDTFPVKVKYYLLDDGTLHSTEVCDKDHVNSPVEYKMKANHEMDRSSGKFYSLKKDGAGNDIRDVEVTKNNAIEVK